MRLMITIVPKGKADAVAKVIGEGLIHHQETMLGRGTAPTDIMEMLAMSERDKEVIFSIVDDNDVNMIYQDLDETFDFKNSHFGVSFTIEIDSIGKMGFNYLYEITEEE
ncbi:hypothetical protein N7603_03620 [Acholeplasma vituli]|uniref:Nitrogen regulatory protein P-II n=1 Tax=Paracholeplasma vituli TaxID=69473 RepID=A0ABT2PYJ6_9MOLU|nr:hypothetical protein [Paracholeplasma vituli]MCU0104738.1 hypothetical protein [Paracholeplasma vituli]